MWSCSATLRTAAAREKVFLVIYMLLLLIMTSRVVSSAVTKMAKGRRLPEVSRGEGKKEAVVIYHIVTM